MREYQEKILKSQNRVVFGNLKRGSGKSYTIAMSIKEDVCNSDTNSDIVVVLQPNGSSSENIVAGYIKDFTKNEVLRWRSCKFKKDEITIINRNGVSTRINFIRYSDDFVYAIKELKARKVYFDDCIPNKDEIKDITLINSIKKVIALFTYIENEEIEYIDDVKISIDDREWIPKEIRELMGEYSSISKCENTTIRREKVLIQIEMLNDLKNKLN